MGRKFDSETDFNPNHYLIWGRHELVNGEWVRVSRTGYASHIKSEDILTFGTEFENGIAEWRLMEKSEVPQNIIDEFPLAVRFFWTKWHSGREYIVAEWVGEFKDGK